MSLHDQSQASRRTAPGILAVALAACSTFTSGCAPFAEKLSALCTTTPPVYGEEMLPPADFGYYQAHWDRWPCNELTIDRGHLPKDTPASKPDGAGSTPGDTTGAENEMNNEGVPGRNDDPNALPDDLFETDRNTPLPDKTPDETAPLTPNEPGLTPPDPNAPDATPPEAPPTDAIPEVQPPAAVPEIPDDLFEEKKPAGVPPGQSSLGTDSLPLDAPEGDLVSDGTERGTKKVAAAKRPVVTPTGPRLGPVMGPAPRPAETARRPSAIRRTSAIEPLPPTKRDVFADEAQADDAVEAVDADGSEEATEVETEDSDGPELLAPVTNRPALATPKSALPERSGRAKSSAVKKAVAAPLTTSTDDAVPDVEPLPSDAREKNGADRWVRTSSSQRQTSTRSKPSRAAVVSDSQWNEANR